MIRRSARFAAAVAFGLPLAGLLAAAGPDAPSTEIVAQVGTNTYTLGDLQALLSHVDPVVREQLLHNPNALTDLVRSQLVRQQLLDEARAKKWDQGPDIVYRANQAHDSVIVDSYLASLTQPDPAYPSEADIATAYEANKTRFVVPRQYHLAQIFIAEPADAPKQADADAQKKLRDLRQTLSRPHADFADAARRISQDKASAARGGEIGWAREDQLVPAIKTVVAGLPDGAISDPVRAADGWHLIKLLDTKPAATAPLADVKDTIVRSLRQQKAQENARAYIQQMQGKLPVELNEIALAHLSQH